MTIMKKILLIVAVALVTISASAANRKYHHKAPIAKEVKTVKAMLGAFKDLGAKVEANYAFYNMSNRETGQVEGFHVQRRAGDDIELQPAYSMSLAVFTSIMGGEIEQFFYDGASFCVTEDGKAYMAPFAKLGHVEGVLDPEAENEYKDYGAVVYKFTCDTIANFTNQTTGDKTPLVLGVCGFEGSSETGWSVVRTDAKTFNAYYFAESNELYFPDALALFNADETVKEVFDETYFADGLDLELQSTLDEFMSKATYSNISYYDDPGTPAVTGDCVAFVGSETALYVQGADAAGANAAAWVKYAADKEVDGLLHVKDYGLLTFGRWYNDATRTDTHQGVLVTMSTSIADGAVAGWSPNKEADYTLTQNADETMTIKSTDTTAGGAYVFMEEGYQGGIYDMLNQTVNILMEPVTAIDAVKAPVAHSAAAYNLAGQKVGKDFKGLVIKDGKKFIQK